MEQVYRKRGRIVIGIALLQLFAALGVMIAGLFFEWFTGFQGNLVMGAGLAIYWILADIVEPRVAHRFDNITEVQKNAYTKYIFWDFLGYAGIAFFLFGMGSTQNNSLIGAIVYAVSMKPKRENQDIFLGRIVPEEEIEEAEEVAEEAQEPEALEMKEDEE